MQCRMCSVLAVLVFMIISLGIPLVSAENTTTTITAPNNATTTTDFTDIFRDILSPSGGSRYVLYIVGSAITFVIILYIWYTPFGFGKKGGSAEAAFAKKAKLSPPRGYDFVVYIVDETEKTITKDYFVKVSENLYMSTNIARPSFLYTPDHVDTYICSEGKSAVPCGLGYRQGLLTMLVDPRLAAAHDLAADAGLIQLNENELDKLLSTLYMKDEKKIGGVPITPDTKIGFTFNLKNMIKGYLGILRSADEMMIHFLHTANQAESIERFMKTAARMQEARLSWLNWVAYFVVAAAVAIGMVMVFVK